MKVVVVAVLFSALLAACGTPPKQLTREETLKMMTRTFDAPVDKVLEAAERVITLVDPSDTRVSHSPQGFTATRSQLYYFVLAGGTIYYNWQFIAAPEGGRTRATLQLSVASQDVLPLITGPISTTSLGSPINSPRPYNLFWDRVSHLLEGQPAWRTCKELEIGGLDGYMEALCGVGSEDLKP